jgi:hypothetical protein
LVGPRVRVHRLPDTFLALYSIAAWTQDTIINSQALLHSMKFVVFGGGGKVARHFARLAIADGHSVISVVRNEDQCVAQLTLSSQRSQQQLGPEEARCGADGAVHRGRARL